MWFMPSDDITLLSYGIPLTALRRISYFRITNWHKDYLKSVKIWYITMMRIVLLFCKYLIVKDQYSQKVFYNIPLSTYNFYLLDGKFICKRKSRQSQPFTRLTKSSLQLDHSENLSCQIFRGWRTSKDKWCTVKIIEWRVSLRTKEWSF